MVRERERPKEQTNEVRTGESLVMNIGNVNNEDDVRETLMDRYNSGESILQPPSSDGGMLGSAIETELEKYR